MNIFKKHLTNQEDLYCDHYEDKIENLNRCIASLNNLRNKYFKEYQSTRYNDLIANTFTKTPEWLRLKRSVLNPNNNDNKCFQYSIILSLHHQQIGRNYSRISTMALKRHCSLPWFLVKCSGIFR